MNWKAACRLAMRSSTNTFTRTNEMTETCAICAARNRATSVMQAGKNDVARSKNRVSIAERSGDRCGKTCMGDWEGDTVIGKNHKGGLVRLAERKSRYVLAGYYIHSKYAAKVTTVITRLLTPYKDKCHTIIFDNGKEFAEHVKMAAELKVDIYFVNPYHFWERGLNENSNGLLRQYFPKAWKLTDITKKQVQGAVEWINHRPRKVLGFKTSHEVFLGGNTLYQATMGCCISNLNMRIVIKINVGAAKNEV